MMGLIGWRWLSRRHEICTSMVAGGELLKWWEVWGPCVWKSRVYRCCFCKVTCLIRRFHSFVAWADVWGTATIHPSLRSGCLIFFPMPFSVGKNDPHWCQELTKMRTEMLGTAYTAQHSDCRVLEQLHLGNVLSPNVLGKHLPMRFCGLYFLFFYWCTLYSSLLLGWNDSSFSCSHHWKGSTNGTILVRSLPRLLVPRSVGELLKYAYGCFQK